MKIIILAAEDDNHTAPIKWALEKAGYTVVCWTGLGWTEQQQASMLLNHDEKDIVTIGNHTVDAGDVVWIRRPEPPVTNPNTSAVDKKFAAVEYRAFFHSTIFTLQTLPVWCINPFSAARLINQKSVQLRIARKCGMKTPATLMSNDPQAVRQFLSRPGTRNICKGFTPHIWQKEGFTSVAITETFELTPEQLPSDEVLTYAPAIYQERVTKEFDVRTVLMGENIYSYALNNTQKALDWRQDATLGHVTAEKIETPPEIAKSILAFAQHFGICFGSLDFGVDAHGQWWFLEINEEGQFLWLDQFNREARLMEKFCAFITAPQGSTVPLEDREHLFPSLHDYEEMPAEQKVQPIPRPNREDPFLSSEV
jgi:glutathione synthase/RimK-type ligase-like ATP-grasp enzyme